MTQTYHPPSAFHLSFLHLSQTRPRIPYAFRSGIFGPSWVIHEACEAPVISSSSPPCTLPRP